MRFFRLRYTYDDGQTDIFGGGLQFEDGTTITLGRNQPVAVNSREQFEQALREFKVDVTVEWVN